MKRYFFLVFTVVLSLLFFGTGSAIAGAKLKIDEESKIDLGFRLQTLYLQTESDLDGDGNYEGVSDFKVRRARIRLKGDVTKHMSMFLQTEFAEDSGASAADMRIIDAIMTLKSDDWLQLLTGVHMAPVMRQNLTSSGALMAIDRPGLVYKNLTWGTRARAAFTNTGYDDSDAGLRGSVDVRDLGATLFGSGQAGDGLGVKYYIGIFDGVQNADGDAERIAARVQFNFGDAEPGYFNASTYLGKKKTIGIGAAYDTQANVAADTTGKRVDYTFYTADVFLDHPVGDGAFTAELGYVSLDLDDATVDLGTPTDPDIRDWKQSQGDGYYIQAGYLINKWQPWIEYEAWSSDGTNDLGSYDLIRLGVTYFMKGHNANVKLGYEVFNADQNIDGSNEDSIGTLVLGFYVTY